MNLTLESIMSRFYYFMTPSWVMLEDTETQHFIRLESGRPLVSSPDLSDADILTLLHHAEQAGALVQSAHWTFLSGFLGYMTVCRVAQNATYRAQETRTLAVMGEPIPDLLSLIQTYDIPVQGALKTLLYGGYCMNNAVLTYCHDVLMTLPPAMVHDHYSVIRNMHADDCYTAMVQYVLTKT